MKITTLTQATKNLINGELDKWGLIREDKKIIITGLDIRQSFEDLAIMSNDLQEYGLIGDVQ